jgi:hypothetical protein
MCGYVLGSIWFPFQVSGMRYLFAHHLLYGAIIPDRLDERGVIEDG